MCVGARALRARSAALSKVIVRTEQNNFAGGGAVAGLVLRAPVEQMLWAPKTHHDILYRMLRTRQKAAPRRSPESWGAQNVPRNRAGKCRNAAGARTVCAAAGARWEDRRQHSQPAAVSITLCTAPGCVTGQYLGRHVRSSRFLQLWGGRIMELGVSCALPSNSYRRILRSRSGERQTLSPHGTGFRSVPKPRSLPR